MSVIDVIGISLYEAETTAVTAGGQDADTRPETLLKTYAHLLPASDGEAAERVASLLAG